MIASSLTHLSPQAHREHSININHNYIIVHNYDYRYKHPKYNNSKPHCVKYVKTNASEPFGTYLVKVAFLH